MENVKGKTSFGWIELTDVDSNPTDTDTSRGGVAMINGGLKVWNGGGWEEVNGGIIAVQGEEELDLTDTVSTTVISSGEIASERGGDKFIPTRVFALVTEGVDADNTDPVITVQDSDGNSTGLTLTISDGTSADDLGVGTVSNGTSMTAVDLTSKDLEVKVTTAGVDAGTEAGKCKVIVEGILVK
jgi:hypothetical protein